MVHNGDGGHFPFPLLQLGPSPASRELTLRTLISRLQYRDNSIINSKLKVNSCRSLLSILFVSGEESRNMNVNEAVWK